MAEKGVFPPGYDDPNHPHYPGDLEHQSDRRHSLFSKKRILIAGIITFTLGLTAVLIWGVAFTRTHNRAAVASQATVTVTVSSFPTTSPEVQTVFETATTVVYTTTHVPKLNIPDLATVTVTVVPAEAPLRPILTKKNEAVTTATATINVLTSASAPAPTPMVLEPRGCQFSGNWPLKSQCEKHCPAWAGHSTHCESDQHARWVCVSCPL